MTSTNSYFVERAKNRYAPRKGLDKELNTDILIVGGGMTGMSTAYELSKRVNPERIAIVDSGRVGFSTTGHSAGLLVDSVEEDYCDMNREIHDELRGGIEGIVTAVQTEKLSCNLRIIPSFYIAKNKSQMKTIHNEFKARRNSGFDIELLHADELRNQYGLDAKMAIRSKEGYCINPAAFCQELAASLERKGVRIYEQTKIMDCNHMRKKAFTASNEINYQKIIWTNSSRFIEREPFGQKALLLSTTVAVTQPLSKDQWGKIFSNGEYLGWDAPRTNYTYFRPVGEDRLLIGGLDKLSTLNDAKHKDYDFMSEKNKQSLSKLFKRHFPNLGDISFSHMWRGVVPASIDNMPLVGELSPNRYAGLYSPGLPNAFRCGQILGQVVAGEIPDSFELFRHDRKIPLKNRIRALTKYLPFTLSANLLFFT